MSGLYDDLRVVEENWDIVNDPEGRVAGAARRWSEFPTDEDVRSDAVLDWIEVHLGHYDWELALAAVTVLLRAVRARETGET